jgi:hypothetical protein
MAHEFGAPCFVHLQDVGKLDARAEEAVFVGVDAQSKAYRIYWAGKRRVSVERNVTFTPTSVDVADDVLAEGESATPGSSEVSAQTTSPANGQLTSPTAPSTPTKAPQPAETPPAPRATRTRPPPGYYASLHEGEIAALAMEPQPHLEASELPHDGSDGPLTWYAMAAAEAEPSLQQALNGPDASEWQEAIDYELGQLEKLGTWEIVNAPDRVNLIPCHYVLATKRGPNGEKLKLRARLVANGQHQKFGVDYFDTFAPTSNMTTIRAVLSMAAKLDWEVHQVDIKSAYLYAELKEDIYMRPPPGYLKEGDEGKVLKLRRSLPGLKQAGYEWSEELASVFARMDFTRSQIDQAVFYRNTDDEHTVITVSVDDMAVTSKHLRHITKFKQQLSQYFDISDLGELNWLLGLKVERDRHARTIRLSQRAYIDTIIERFHLEDAKHVASPMETGVVLSDANSPSTHAQTEAMRNVPYQRAIGSLMYAATSTRPDIAFAVAILSQFMRNPGVVHWDAVKRVLRYLKGSADYGITLGGSDTGLEAYADADWASQTHRHSMTGYIAILDGGPVAWSSRKQPIIALSTAEAEYIALTTVGREIMYLQLLLEELYQTTPIPTPLYCDNQAAIALATNNKFHSRTKHIDLRYHFVRFHVQHGTFTLVYCPTDDNVADALTKALPRPRLERLRGMMKVDCTRGGVLESERPIDSGS